MTLSKKKKLVYLFEHENLFFGALVFLQHFEIKVCGFCVMLNIILARFTSQMTPN